MPTMTQVPLAADRPTRVRHFVVFLTTMVAVLLYLDRICLSIVERYVKDGLGLSNFQVGVLLSAFFWTYAIGQVPAGWLSDRYGARLTLALYVVLWSTFTGLMGLAAGLVFLLMLRLGCGLTEAGAYPACASLLSRWVPAARRGLASGIVSIGGRLGGAIAPVLTAFLVVAFVPLERSSLLTSADVPDPKALCQLLVKPDKKTSASLAAAVSRRLPADAAAVVHVDSSAPLTEAQTTVLLAGLNKVLADPTLRDDVNPTEMGLPAINDPGARDELVVERDNRLMLEAGFPTAILSIYRNAWRPVMLIYGAFGVVIGGIFWLFFRDRPRLHPACNAAEVALIEGTRSAHLPEATALCGVLSRSALLPPALVESIRASLPAVAAAPFQELASSGDGKKLDEPQRNILLDGLDRVLVDPGLRDKVAQAVRAVNKSSPLPFRTLARDWNLWLISVASFGTNFGWGYLLTWFPRYLLEVHKVPLATRSWMTGFPLLVGIPALYLGGWLTDFITQRAGAYRGRCVLLSASRVLVLLAFASCLWLRSPWLVTVAMLLVSFGTDLGTPAFWAYSQDVGGRHVGSVLGWLNMWGNFGGALSPLLLGLLVDRGLWGVQFVCCAVAFLTAAIAILAVNPSRPIDFEQPMGSAA